MGSFPIFSVPTVGAESELYDFDITPESLCSVRIPQEPSVRDRPTTARG